MTDKQVNDFIALATKTGRIMVAKDVYEALGKLPTTDERWSQLNKLEVAIDPCLAPGSVMVVRFEDVHYGRVFGTPEMFFQE